MLTAQLCITEFFAFLVHRPIFGCHGSFLLTNGLVENAVTWDLGSLTEDYQFSVHAWEKGFMCGKIPGLVREQSPMDLIGFLKQRRRWYVGIRRLPLALPKIWAFFWTLGILCLYGTLISIPLGIIYNFGTPRWFGLLKVRNKYARSLCFYSTLLTSRMPILGLHLCDFRISVHSWYLYTRS